MEIKSLVTIIIPTFNREKKLPDAIKSALNQTYSYTQIIIIDDGSTDNTAELIKQYEDIEYYYQENKGQAAARNHGLRHAKGSIIASLDSDDIWHPNFLATCVEKLEKENLDFVFANWKQEAKIGESWNFLANDPFLMPFFHKEKNNWINLTYSEVRNLYLKSCPSPSSSVVMRKSSIVSSWDETMNIGDDWCMYLDMILSKECFVAFTLENLWWKRIDEINIYDGRKWSEVLEFLHIADLKRNMQKFKHLLSSEEYRILEERYMCSLVELSKHKLIREFNMVAATKLLNQSFSIDIPFTLKKIPAIFMLGLNRKIEAIRTRTHS